MKQKLIDSLKYRLATEIAPQNPVKFLKEIELNKIVDIATSIIFLYTRSKGTKRKPAYISEVISAIGHTIRNKYKFKRDSAVAAKAGAFILYSFEELDICKISMITGPKGHGAYIVEILNEDIIADLFRKLPIETTEKLPNENPYTLWKTAFHSTGAKLVKTNNQEVLEKLTSETHPHVFETVNRAMKIGWTINNDIFEIQEWALRNKTEAFSDIWEQHNPEAKATKLREAKTIGDIAKRFLNKTFYHLYYLDFRGRKYPATAYLHEQGSDLAKGLLLRADKKKIGEQGFFWLCISIANNWAGACGRDDGRKSDKIPLKDRYKWVLDNEEIFLSYADNPKVNRGWMSAECPWQFLAACNELYKFRIWQLNKEVIDEYGYESHLECYIDGSNNGSQHLSALTKDEITAPHVNLTPSYLPGDLYTYVAEHVWKHLDETVQNLSPEYIKRAEIIIDTLLDLKTQISQAPQKSERRAELIEQILEFRKEHNKEIIDIAPIFWWKIRDKKDQRKICKRNIMTLPYGGTPYGLGNQQIDDAKKHGIDQLLGMEHRWGSFMGRAIYEDCKVSLARPMQLLSVFENAGKIAEENGEFLSWTVPITNFPVVQNYTEGTVKRVYIQYGPPLGEKTTTGYYENTLQLHICFLEHPKPSKRKQSQGASPNAIHSLDAAHLMLTVNNCNFPITTIHDSYGCLLGDMPELYKIVRESFVELYNSDPLIVIMERIKGDISQIEFGNLDINLITESEYAFA